MPTETELTRRALDLVSTMQRGVLMTCDARGRPHGRWMHLLPMHGLRHLFALTAGGARKLEHIAGNPEVAWLVTGDQDETVLLKGTASVNRDAAPAVWDRLAPVMRPYAFGAPDSDDRLELVAIETLIEEIELTSPPMGVLAARPIRIDG